RLREFHVHGCADRATREARVRRLHDVDLADEIRADGAEVEAAAGVAARVSAERRWHLAPVIERRVEARAGAADRGLGGRAGGRGHAAERAGAAAYRNARDALNGGGEIGVREFADVFRRDGVDDTERFLLDVEALLQRGAQSCDHDLLNLAT